MPKLYVDMDGVLSNFEKGVETALPGKTIAELLADNDNWQEVKRSLAQKKLFRNLEKMPDADELWAYIKKHDPIILSATGYYSSDAVAQEKREWVHENFGSDVKVLIVTKSHEKKKYAKGNILIDDREKSLEPWKEAGGIGVHHKNTRQTIKELKRIGL